MDISEYIKRLGKIGKIDMQPYAKELLEKIEKNRQIKKPLPAFILPRKLKEPIKVRDLAEIPNMDLEKIYKKDIEAWLRNI